MMFKEIVGYVRWLIKEATPALSRYSDTDIAGNPYTGEQFLKAVINDSYKQIVTAVDWDWARKTTSIEVEAGASYFYAPSDFYKVHVLRDSDTVLRCNDAYSVEWAKTSSTTGPITEYAIGELDTSVKESLTAQSGTDADTVVLSGADGDSDDYYAGQFIYNATRGGTQVRVLSSTYSGGTNTLQLNTSITDQSAGDSIFIYRNARKVYIYPTPEEATTLYMHYQVSPYPLVNDYDVPIIPPQYVNAICYLAAYRAMVEKNAQTAAIFFNEFTKILQQMHKQHGQPAKLYRRAFTHGINNIMNSGFRGLDGYSGGAWIRIK